MNDNNAGWGWGGFRHPISLVETRGKHANAHANKKFITTSKMIEPVLFYCAINPFIAYRLLTRVRLTVQLPFTFVDAQLGCSVITTHPKFRDFYLSFIPHPTLEQKEYKKVQLTARL